MKKPEEIRSKEVLEEIPKQLLKKNKLKEREIIVKKKIQRDSQSNPGKYR